MVFRKVDGKTLLHTEALVKKRTTLFFLLLLLFEKYRGKNIDTYFVCVLSEYYGEYAEDQDTYFSGRNSEKDPSRGRHKQERKVKEYSPEQEEEMTSDHHDNESQSEAESAVDQSEEGSESPGTPVSKSEDSESGMFCNYC